MQAEAIDFPAQGASQTPDPAKDAAVAPRLRRAQRDPEWVRWLLTFCLLRRVRSCLHGTAAGIGERHPTG